MKAFPPSKLTVTLFPFKVGTSPAVRSVDNTVPETTWYSKICASSPVGSSSNSVTTDPNAAKAASVGANTVKGPAPERSSSNSAAITAASSVLWSGLFTITSTTVSACRLPKNRKENERNVNMNFFITKVLFSF